MAINTVSIVGCGWLGLPLAKALVEQGYRVKGSRQQLSDALSLKQWGIEGYQLSLRPEVECNDIAGLLDCELLLINIPPRRREHSSEVYRAQIDALLEQAQFYGVKNILFISSTSVYGSLQGEVDEASECMPETPSGKTLLKIEQQLMRCLPQRASVLRFAGLIGAQRQPGRFLSGKTLGGASSPVNLIHLDDCIGIISALIARNVWGEIFNACAEQHPNKKAFYTRAAQLMGLPLPQFTDEAGSNKKIHCNVLKQQINYRFLHPDPLAFIEK